MTGALVFALAMTACAGTARLTPVITALLRRHGIIDHPREGSGHVMPRPRGGGIAVIGVILALLAGALPGLDVPAHFLAMLAGTIILAAVSFADDARGLGVNVRLAAQLVVILPCALAFPRDFLIFQGMVPFEVDRVVVVLSWLWFVNLMNFMDGIDGMTGMEAAFIGLGVAGLLLFTGAGPDWLLLAAAATGGSALGFLVWNWQPARVFIGDVGAIPLGFICGWILLNLAALGYLLPAVLIPLYHCFDATATLALRVVMRRDLARRHRSHFFQRAIRAGYTHAQTVLMLALVNVSLLASAFVAADPGYGVFDVIAMAMAGLTLAAVLLHFRQLVPIPRDQL